MENVKRCDNCFFSVWMMGPGRSILTCKQRVRFVGRWRFVGLEQSCANFYPSGIFKAGSRAVRRIALTRGKFAIVDPEDYYHLAKYNWQASSSATTFYAYGKVRGKSIMMHRVIMNPPAHLSVDHIDHNGLNNTRSNLRLCSPTQNNCNKLSRNGVSRYKGVSWNRARKKWVAAIQHNGTKYQPGYFTDEIDAAKAYDKKAVELHGEFACLNFPQEAENLNF